MITTVDEAHAALEQAIADAQADNPEVGADDIGHDMVVAVCWEIEDDEVAREFCRTQLGSIPFDLERRLGRMDWVE